MSSEELMNIVARLKEQGKMKFLDGATAEQIADFESEKSIIFPDRFRDWLLHSDGGELFLPAGIQLYGVAHKPIIDVDEDDRPDDSYVVIGALASGDPILCETSGERIAIYNHEAGRIESNEIYNDFFAFLNDLYAILGIGD